MQRVASTAMVSESEGDLLNHFPRINMFNTELTLSQLRGISGSGAPKNEYAKYLKPKAKKEIKPLKPLTLKDVMNNGGSPGPFLPGPDYVSQYASNAYNHHVRWM